MSVVRDPGDLYEVSPGAPVLDGAVMLHYLDGFIDAGAAGKLLSAHLLGTLEHEEVVRFDVDLVRIPGRSSAAVVELTVESHPFVRYAADAVIVATPTGSTAYNFSAGGPLVSPSAEGLLVTPVAPHTAFNRALFLASSEKVLLTVLPTSGELAVEADGIVVGFVHAGDAVELGTLPAAANVVRLGRTTFYQRAQRKLRLTGSAEAD